MFTEIEKNRTKYTISKQKIKNKKIFHFYEKKMRENVLQKENFLLQYVHEVR